MKDLKERLSIGDIVILNESKFPYSNIYYINKRLLVTYIFPGNEYFDGIILDDPFIGATFRNVRTDYIKKILFHKDISAMLGIII